MLPREWWKLSALWFLNLKSRTPPVRKSLFLNSFRTSVIGLALSVAALSVTLSIFTGFEDVLAQSISSSLGHVIHFMKWHTNAELEAIAKEAPPGVEKTIFFWTSQALLVGPNGGRGVMIEGRTGTRTPVTPGGPVLAELGKPLAETLGVKVGDKFQILLPGIVRGSLDAQVVKILEYGMYDIDSRLAIVINESLQPLIEKKDPESYAQRPGDAHGIRFILSNKGHKVRDVAWLEAWKADYEARLKARGLDDSNAIYKTWKEMQKNLLGSIGLDKQVLIVVMGLLTLVATLNVAATLVVLFLERDREMAVLRAIGLSPRGLMSWIGIQGFLMGLLASTLGLVLAWIFGIVVQRLPIAQLPSDIYHIGHLPLSFDFKEQGATLIFGVLCSIMIAWLLGLRLAKTNLLHVLGQRR